MEEKTLSKAVTEFSKQFFRFKDSSRQQPEKKLSETQIVQKKIDDLEVLRIERIIKQYQVFQNPVSQQIEEDEANLLKAYNLFLKILEVNVTEGNENTKLKELKIQSPLCSKSEYICGSGFAFLKVWFVKNQSEVKFIPEIILENENRYLEFFNAEDYIYSNFEKEIFQQVNKL